MAASTPVVIASDQSPLPTLPNFSSTGTTSSVASAAGNVMLLAANAGRKGAAIFNDSNKFLYLKLGATASVTDFTALLRQGDYYEVPFDFQGQIDGIWSAANGFARITELT
ncbi:MAG: hypothetical protein A2Y38_13865 [Spirochaetes bacterium GWB1_59_5]|nr:MAG: hypothetical protein A2Y38_13865 [Spirochaetes bacterium GWB1_59_5]